MRSLSRAALVCAAAGLLCACGSAPLLQSTLPAPTLTAGPVGAPAATTTPDPPTATAGPSPTINSPATSRAVILTITALAATPTYPPTATPRPTRIVVGAGPDEPVPAATAPPAGVTARPLALQVTRGGVAAMTVRAQPGAVCGLWRVINPAGQRERQPISGVNASQAPADGVIAWIWTVADDLPAGALDLMVDCGSAGSAAARIDVLR